MKRLSHGLLAAVVFALASCNDGEIAAPPADVAPQYSWDDDFDGFFAERQPDLRFVAKFKTQPAPPDPLNDHKMIGPAGGSLRVGDFEIIVPAGAVERPTNFRIRIPVDPRAAEHAYAEFSPHMIFRKPVTLRLPRSSTTVEGMPYAMWWASFIWLPLPTSLTNDGRIETQVWHFSYYGTSSWSKGIIVFGG